jgi:hypothetical protein
MGAKHPDAFEVDEPYGQRWATALELLAEGKEIFYRRIGLSVSEPGLIVADVPAWYDVDGMPQGVALRDLANGEATVRELVSANAGFAILASGRAVEVRLVDDSYRWVYAIRRDGATKFTEAWSRRHSAGP